jgi:hypothetical protein
MAVDHQTDFSSEASKTWDVMEEHRYKKNPHLNMYRLEIQDFKSHSTATL